MFWCPERAESPAYRWRSKEVHIVKPRLVTLLGVVQEDHSRIVIFASDDAWFSTLPAVGASRETGLMGLLRAAVRAISLRAPSLLRKAMSRVEVAEELENWRSMIYFRTRIIFEMLLSSTLWSTPGLMGLSTCCPRSEGKIYEEDISKPNQTYELQ